jgi:(1->4)-alpha-D-glucan 1-alpha-D-glucosylmutase
MRIPVATYRFQFNRNFRYPDAQALVPYLHRLGISHLYASPAFQARQGSEHGYDVADPTRLNAEVGTQLEFDALVRELHRHGMDLLLDIVPNHMAASPENPWWNDVLENGEKSRYAHFYDIDWDAELDTPGFSGEAKSAQKTGQAQVANTAPHRKGRVLLPVLGSSYIDVLNSGELMARVDDQGFYADYHGLRIPLAPETYADILGAIPDESAESASHRTRTRSKTLPDKLHRKLQSLIRNSHELDASIAPNARSAKVARLKRQLRALRHSSKAFRAALDRGLGEFAGSEENARAAQRLDQLLSKQSYQLAYWRAAQESINYRRFFDINDLVSLRVELPNVFHARHALIAHLIKHGAIGALRVDHVDGLRDPLDYLRRARTELRKKNRDAVYTIVEKITCGRETLPPAWPIEGTTGYDFLNAANFVFTSGPGYQQLEKLHCKLTGDPPSFEAAWEAGKLKVIDQLFRSEAGALTARLTRLAAIDRRAHSLTRPQLEQALKEITACLPVYRTYIRGDSIPPTDQQTLRAALRLAWQRAPSAAATGENAQSSPLTHQPVKAFFTRLLTRRIDAPENLWRREWLEFMLRWQVFTGPVMAKGFEDTAFYTFIPLISLNDVGSNPSRDPHFFGAAPFHKFIATRAAGWPHSLNATSTHDTKRSEDVRARINVISEIPSAWSAAVARWRKMNRRHAFGENKNQQETAPSPREESLIYQSLVGVWPLHPQVKNAFSGLAERMRNFIIKAVREAKESSTWLDPNQHHENQLEQFISRILNPRANKKFIADFDKFHARLAPAGAVTSLAQILLKIAAPGVPDFYRGNDFWSFSLTDPDNRRPVDFRKRLRLFNDLQAQLDASSRTALCADLTANWKDSRIKLFLTTLALQFRNAHSDLFTHGDYTPLRASGPHAENILAFTRSHRGHTILVAFPRLAYHLTDPRSCTFSPRAFNSTRLLLPRPGPSRWLNIFTLESISSPSPSLPAAPLFGHLPFALLTSQSASR